MKVEDDTWVMERTWGHRAALQRDAHRIDYLSEMKLKFKDTPKFSGTGPGLNAILQLKNLLNTELNLGCISPDVMGSFYQELASQWAVMATWMAAMVEVWESGCHPGKPGCEQYYGGI